jgi:alkanesulfonate monooxygenase SsuD/methylene tetrahydromethanopterin reductase-like flavin-dependent oxidoreductase (luciferase family)
MIRVGYFPCQQDPPSAQHIDRLWKEVIVEAGVAEEAGFDSCLFSEHHQQADGYLPNPLILAGLVRAVKDRFVIGSPEECRDEIRRWCEEIRPNYLILRMRHPGGPPHARVVEAIRLFGDKVLPHL